MEWFTAGIVGIFVIFQCWRFFFVLNGSVVDRVFEQFCTDALLDNNNRITFLIREMSTRA